MNGRNGPTNGPGLFTTVPSGSPRSHARLSKSPKMWQLAHAESPWLDVRRRVVEEAAGRSRRSPARDCGAARARARSPVPVLTTEIAVVEARQHVELGARLVEHEAGRPAAATGAL